MISRQRKPAFGKPASENHCSSHAARKPGASAGASARAKSATRATALLALASLVFVTGCSTNRKTQRPKNWETPYASAAKDVEGVYHSLCQHQDGKRSRFDHLDDLLGEYFKLDDQDSRYFRITAIKEQQITLELFDAGGSPLSGLLFDISDDEGHILAAPVGVRTQHRVHLNKLALTTTDSGHLTVFLAIEYRNFPETRGFEHYLRCEAIQRKG